MKSIEIVSHCWRYSRVLNYQLASLLRHPPDARVTLRVFYAAEDEATVRLLKWADDIEDDIDVSGQVPKRVTVSATALPIEQLLNRNIGRNLAARETQADLVWFCDCDYWFGRGCLDALARLSLPADQQLFFPRTILQNRTGENGDCYALRAAGKPQLLDIDPADFEKTKIRRAVGGLQIARGATARQHGYCPESQRLVSDGVWKTTFGDQKYRSHFGTYGQPIHLPNLYRIRQSVPREVDTLKATAGKPASGSSSAGAPCGCG